MRVIALFKLLFPGLLSLGFGYLSFGVSSPLNTKSPAESDMATEKEKMIAERLYIASDAQLSAERTAARKLCDEYNRTTGIDNST